MSFSGRRRKRLVRTVALAPILFIVATCQSISAGHQYQSQSATQAGPEIAVTIERLLNTHDVPGIALAVISEGAIAQIHTYGWRDREKRAPLTSETVMAAMSWTKFVFAAYVAQLAVEGKVDLDLPIGEYLPKPLPSYPQYADLEYDERWRLLTLRLLLSHQSGLPNFRFLPPHSDFDRDAALAFFRNPGDAYGYSGEGYQIAQLVVSEALGLDVERDIERRFIERLDLQRTSFRWQERFQSDFDVAYAADGHPLGHDRRPQLDAAGSMNSSVRDFAALVAAFLNDSLVSPNAKRLILSPQTRIPFAHQFPPWSEERNPELANIELMAGLGVVLWQGRQGRGFFKGGHDDGGDNFMVCLMEEAKCVLLMSNSPKGHLVFPQIVESIVGPTDLPWSWEYSQLSNAQ